MLSAAMAPTYQSGSSSVSPAGASSSHDIRAAAAAFLGALAKELSAGAVDLPCFPNVVLRIRNALANPKITPEQTVAIVGAEPRLAARLLQTANSAAFNPSGRPLTDLRTAITRLGHQLVQSAAMAFAVQHMKNEESLRTIADSLSDLWKESIAIAAISQAVARRTKVNADEAFLTGLLHGIGRLYILVRAVGNMDAMGNRDAFLELVAGWHPSIGKSVLANWGFAEEMSDAVGEQLDTDRRPKRDPNLSDILMVSIALARQLSEPAPRVVNVDAHAAFATIGLSGGDCATILAHSEYQLRSLQDALGC